MKQNNATSVPEASIYILEGTGHMKIIVHGVERKGGDISVLMEMDEYNAQAQRLQESI
jgi:hypothetical protein